MGHALRHLRAQQAERDPQKAGVDEESKPEMRGQPHRAHARVVHEAAFHHVPAEPALEPAERENARELPRERGRERAPPQEIHERKQEDGADDPSQQPMEILPPEDRLEALERHVVVAEAEFGGEAVLRERLLPLRRVEWRNRSDERLPFDDRKPRMRKTRDSAHDDHREHERATGEEPHRDCAVWLVGRIGRHRGRDCARPRRRSPPRVGRFYIRQPGGNPISPCRSDRGRNPS